MHVKTIATILYVCKALDFKNPEVSINFTNNFLLFKMLFMFIVSSSFWESLSWINPSSYYLFINYASSSSSKSSSLKSSISEIFPLKSLLT